MVSYGVFVVDTAGAGLKENATGDVIEVLFHEFDGLDKDIGRWLVNRDK